MARRNVFSANVTTRTAVLRTLGSIAILLAASSVAQASTLNVCKSGCTYSTIQAAVNAANTADVIQIGAGTYFENIVITKSLTLLGGGEDFTVIDGSSRGPVITDFFGSTDLTVVGVTVTHGGQGGIVVSNQSLTLTNSIIASNDGPGLFLFSETNATISGSVITHNENRTGAITVNGNALGAQGGGISTAGDLGIVSTITIVNSSVVRNTAPNGGGIFADENQRLSVSNSSISDNTASLGDGGGIYITPEEFPKVAPGGSLRLDSSTVENNHATTDGGGICGSAVIFNSVVARNTAGHNGGGISNADSCIGSFAPPVLQLTTVTVAGNSASNVGGGISATNVTADGVVIVQNTAGAKDGGIVASTLTLVGTTLATQNIPNNCDVPTGGCPNP